MASKNPHLPSRVPKTVFSKATLLADLLAVDIDAASRNRVLVLETGFRQRVQSHIASLPIANALLEDFKTNPFV